MKILVTGASGFVGSHFSSLPNVFPLEGPNGEFVDINDKNALTSALERIKPDRVLHLAGQSFVPESFENPEKTYQVNFMGTFNVLEALKATAFKGRILFVSSGTVYGKGIGSLITEDCQIAPLTPYAVSKAAGEALCYQFSQTAPFEVIIARPFNQVGPGQNSRFVLPSFAKQIIEIKRNKQKKLQVGNLDVERDFLDVRDAARAYLLLLQDGKNGHAYNVCQGIAFSLRSIVDQLTSLAGLSQISIDCDQKRVRKKEMPRFVGSAQKLFDETGWEPKIPLEKTLRDLLDEWENKNNEI